VISNQSSVRDEKNHLITVDALAKSQKPPFSVIPAQAGIQFIHRLTKHLDSGDPVPAKAGNRGDDFLREHLI
jgi:hypothetical protein